MASQIEEFATACRVLTASCKKLEYLDYEFPADAAINDVSEDDIEDLTLREWDRVELWAWEVLKAMNR